MEELFMLTAYLPWVRHQIDQLLLRRSARQSTAGTPGRALAANRPGV